MCDTVSARGKDGAGGAEFQGRGRGREEIACVGVVALSYDTLSVLG